GAVDRARAAAVGDRVRAGGGGRAAAGVEDRGSCRRGRRAGGGDRGAGGGGAGGVAVGGDLADRSRGVSDTAWPGVRHRPAWCKTPAGLVVARDRSWHVGTKAVSDTGPLGV